jgi:hypothetical protein
VRTRSLRRHLQKLVRARDRGQRPPMISSSRSLSAAAQCPVRHAGRRGERLRGRWFGASRRDPVHRGGAGHGPPTTIRLRMAIAGCTCPPVQREPTTSRRGSRSANIRIVNYSAQGVELTELPTTRRVTLCSPSSRCGLSNTPAHAAPSPRGPSFDRGCARRDRVEARSRGLTKKLTSMILC